MGVAYFSARLWASATLGVNLTSLAAAAAVLMSKPSFKEASPQGHGCQTFGGRMTNLQKEGKAARS